MPPCNSLVQWIVCQSRHHEINCLRLNYLSKLNNDCTANASSLSKTWNYTIGSWQLIINVIDYQLSEEEEKALKKKMIRIQRISTSISRSRARFSSLISAFCNWLSSSPSSPLDTSPALSASVRPPGDAGAASGCEPWLPGLYGTPSSSSSSSGLCNQTRGIMQESIPGVHKRLLTNWSKT